ncbi:thioredoxin reductase [Halosegnis longus]|uniref:thioredoxin reductase n=1 Tax=Halosegnis longus TaxID=2216012 RepID=UPI00096AC806|nr:thioredoxin reductase [Salella cibi]
MAEADHDVVVVGGGPSGTGAAVFTARYGLDTVVYDRGNAALARAAYVENYPGFPEGIDPATLTQLFHDHLDVAGARRIPDLVESVERVDGEREGDPARFRVTPADGEAVTARYVVAAAWYDGSYLRPLDASMFETETHHGEEREQLDRDVADDDGTTHIPGLYIAAPTDGRNAQAIVAAGHGAHVARTLIAAEREAEGLSGGLVPEYDWVRPDSTFSGEWADRDRWREWFANERGEDDLSEERAVELRERYIDRAFASSLTDEAVESRKRAGVAALVDRLDTDAVLDAVDDDVIAAYLAEDATADD